MTFSEDSFATGTAPTPAANALRILVADDHAVVREGTRLMIERQAGWEVCGVAANGREAVEKAIELQPDIIVLDLHMPELDGRRAVQELKMRVPTAELVIFSGQHSERVIAQLFEAGAKSFIRKVDAPQLLIDAIAAAAEHKPFFTREVSSVLFARFMPDEAATGNGVKLTSREHQIVRLIAEGKSNKGTADALGISVRTTETHRAAILRKLRFTSTAEIVRYAIRNGIIEA